MSPSQQTSGSASSPRMGNALRSGISGLSLNSSGPTPMRGLSPISRLSPIPENASFDGDRGKRAWDPYHSDAQAERAFRIRACLDLTTVILTIPSNYRGVLSDRFSAFMVDLDRVASLAKTAARLQRMHKDGEFPHSYNSMTQPTLQYQKGVKDLWETHWNLPTQNSLRALKISMLKDEIAFTQSQQLRIAAVTEEKAVIKQCFESISARYQARTLNDKNYVVIADKDENGATTIHVDESTWKPLDDEFQALALDLPVLLRKVYDLKTDQIERAVSDFAKKEAKKQARRDLDVEMTNLDPNSPEVKMTLNQLVQQTVGSALKKMKESTPASKKVSLFYNRDDLVTYSNELATRFPEEWFLEEEAVPPLGSSSDWTEEQEGEEEQDRTISEGPSHREEASCSTGSRKRQSAQAWQRRERQRETQAIVADIQRKPWTFGIPNTYPDEILLLPPSIQYTALLPRAPVEALDANRFRSLVHVQPGVVVPVDIQHDLSASLKFMFETKIDGSLILKSYADLIRRIRWKWYFMDKLGEDYDPDYEVPKDKKAKEKEPPSGPAHIERGLAAGQDYVNQLVQSIPELRRKGESLVSLNTKRAQSFTVANNLIVTATDKNLGVAIFKRDWILNQAIALFGNELDYIKVSPDETLTYLNHIAKLIDELCDIHLNDQDQLSKFMTHNVPNFEDRNEWSNWAKFVPEAYAIPKIHKNPWKGRPICPGYCLPQNAASKFLSKVTRPYIDNLPWVIQGSKDFVKKLLDVKIPVGKKAWIVSADVVNFYPSVNTDELLKILQEFAERILVPGEIENSEKYTQNDFFRRLDFYEKMFEIALKPPAMTFLSTILVQQKGLPMGAAGSPDAANIYGAYHEHNWMDRLTTHPDILFYGRYLDDIMTIVLAETADEAANMVTFINLGGVDLLWEPPTCEGNFLDLSLRIEEDGHISHTPFVKAMSHRERIPWKSAHPLDVKKGTLSRGYARTYCCPTRGIVLGLLAVGMVGIKGVVGGSVGRRGEWGDRSYGVMGWK